MQKRMDNNVIEKGFKSYLTEWISYNKEMEPDRPVLWYEGGGTPVHSGSTLQLNTSLPDKKYDLFPVGDVWSYLPFPVCRCSKTLFCNPFLSILVISPNPKLTKIKTTFFLLLKISPVTSIIYERFEFWVVCTFLRVSSPPLPCPTVSL